MVADGKDPLIGVYFEICLAEETMDIKHVQRAKRKLLEIIAVKYEEDEDDE